MIDFLTPFIVLALIAVIIVQAVERYFYSEQVNRERHDMLKFILSRNARDYTDITHVDKKIPEAQTNLSDEVDLTEADDDVFDKLIKNT